MSRLFYVFAILMSLSCQKQGNISIASIDIDTRVDVKLSNIADSIGMVALHTSDDCLISRVVSVVPCDTCFFVNDGCHRVLQFDSHGHFVQQVGAVGKGPGEYQLVLFITADYENSKLCIVDSKQILIYGFDGKYEDRIVTKNFVEELSVINGQLITIESTLGIKNQAVNYENVSYLHRYLLNGQPIDTFCVLRIVLPFLQATSNPMGFCISQGQDNNYLYYPVLVDAPIVQDTLWRIAHNCLQPYFRFDFGLSGEEAQNRNFKVLGISMYNQIAIIRYIADQEDFVAYYNFNLGVSHNVRAGFVDDIFGTGKANIFPLSTAQQLVYFVKYGYELNGLPYEVRADDNPVIFFMKLKDDV